MYEIGNILFLLCPEKIWSTEDDLGRWSDILTKSCNEKLKHENLILMNCDSVGNHNNYKILGKSINQSEGYFTMNSNKTDDIVKDFISQHKELGVEGNPQSSLRSDSPEGHAAYRSQREFPEWSQSLIVLMYSMLCMSEARNETMPSSMRDCALSRTSSP